ncbi:MAG: type IV pilin [Methanoregula sp.]|nr:type IV pilin [Methanoregula sp.]
MKPQNEIAVSPVVGVMLMLVVVIIIAAVVSGFAGSLIGGNNQKPPQITMDVKIVNGGYYTTSYFAAVVTGVDKPMDTKDLKLVTSWKALRANGTKVSGGATIVPGKLNTQLHYNPCAWLALDWWNYTSPQAYGAGMEGNAYFWPVSQLSGKPSSCPSKMSYSSIGTCLSNESWWGNHPLVTGTSLYARPFGWSATPSQGGQPGSSFTVGYGMSSTGSGVVSGGGKYNYAYGTAPGSGGSGQGAHFYPPDDPTYPSIDQMMAMLGNNWNELRPGDIVTVQLIHTPTGKTIWQKDVAVEG